jgi:hypothetical protein
MSAEPEINISREERILINSELIDYPNNLLTMLFQTENYQEIKRLCLIAVQNYPNGRAANLEFFSAIYAEGVHHLPEVQKIILENNILNMHYPYDSIIKMWIGHENYVEIADMTDNYPYSIYNFGMFYRHAVGIHSDISFAIFTISLLIKRSDYGKLLPLLKQNIRAIININRSVGLFFLCICNYDEHFSLILECFSPPPTSDEIATIIHHCYGITLEYIPILISTDKNLSATSILGAYIEALANNQFPKSAHDTTISTYAEPCSLICKSLIDLGADLPPSDVVERAIINSINHCLKWRDYESYNSSDKMWNGTRFMNWISLLTEWNLSNKSISNIQKIWFDNILNIIDKKKFDVIDVYWKADIYIIVMLGKEKTHTLNYLTTLLAYSEKYARKAIRSPARTYGYPAMNGSEVSKLLHKKVIDALHKCPSNIIKTILDHSACKPSEADIVRLYYMANTTNTYKKDVFSEKNYDIVSKFNNALTPLSTDKDYYGVEKIIAQYAFDPFESHRDA